MYFCIVLSLIFEFTNKHITNQINTIIQKIKDMEIKTKRIKRQIPEMLPVKEMLSAREAQAYLDMGVTNFSKVVKDGNVTVTKIGGKLYYKVADLKTLFTPVLQKI